MTWVGWAILSAIFAAATALLAKIGVAHVDSNLATAVRTTVVVLFAWGIALALGKHGELRSLDRRTLLFLTLYPEFPSSSGILSQCLPRQFYRGSPDNYACEDQLP